MKSWQTDRPTKQHTDMREVKLQKISKAKNIIKTKAVTEFKKRSKSSQQALKHGGDAEPVTGYWKGVREEVGYRDAPYLKLITFAKSNK